MDWGQSLESKRWHRSSSNTILSFVGVDAQNAYMFPMRRVFLLLTMEQSINIISLLGGYMAYRPKDQKERVVHRLKIAQGHLKKVQQMVEEDAYCIDVIHQSQAVQKALKTIDSVILENHLKECVTDAISEGRTDEAVSEVMNVFKKAN